MDPHTLIDKDHARVFQMDVPCPKKQLLLFPGWNFDTGRGAICLHAAVTKAMIDRRTQILCVEHAPANVPLIAEQIELLGLTSRTRFHTGPLHDLTLKPVERFDYAFFDLHQALDEATAIWIADRFAPQVLDGADVSFSLRHTDRWSPLYRLCRLAFGSTYRRNAQAVRTAFGIQDRQVLIHALTVLTLFRDFRLTYHPERVFSAGTTTMVAFKLGALHRHTAPTDWPTLRDVIEAGQRRSDTLEAEKGPR